jgi:toxin ParE1/3/4
VNEVRYTPEAAGDLQEVHAFIESRGGEAHATKTIRRILHSAVQLAGMPRMGMLREQAGQQVRVFLAEPYLMYYREVEGGILLLRVIHGRRDQAQALGPEDATD